MSFNKLNETITMESIEKIQKHMTLVHEVNIIP